MKAVVEGTGGDDASVVGAAEAEVLADRLVREAGRWRPSDLIHTPDIGCCLNVFKSDRKSGVLDVRVKWSVSTPGVIDNPKSDRTWHQVNDRPPAIPSAMPAVG
ncbi:hypothetical protein [Streptomyces sp. sk226]|uniref:hypothetical protein n=1 Tax=Streptomyces sp. sk226 TaxID=2034268 RepID=UPI001184AE6B|nr:hypothetical protein [Streptomyces sp. sk226]